MNLSQRTRALVLLLCMHSEAPAQAQETLQPPPGSPTPALHASSDELTPKFVWGFLLNVVFKYAMQTFAGWLANKLTTEMSASNTQRLMMESASAIIAGFADTSPFGAKGLAAKENTTTAVSSAPLRLDAGKENYQGAHIALIGFDAQGTATGIRPLTSGFRTGERFKLKILTTFDGVLVLENAPAEGKQAQIYPPRLGDALLVPSGRELMLPIGIDEYFEFTGDTGNETLVVTLRDPRATVGKESSAPAQRDDTKSGSAFIQEVKADTFPVIAQSIQLRHTR